MTISFVTGDLFTTPGLDALAHGCNCAGAMGRGIAVEFKRRWPEMFRDYRVKCELGTFVPGSVLSYRFGCFPPQPWRAVFCLGTQEHWRGPGAKATLAAIGASVAGMLSICEQNTRWGVKRIGIPTIGAGLGGLQWESVEPVVRRAAEKSKVELVVVQRGRV